MQSYKKLVRQVLNNGSVRRNRTGIDTLSLFGLSWEHDMQKGLPILTTKKMYVKGCIHELLWFLSGDTNIKYLQGKGVHIWDAWADQNGDLGPVYGKQWRNSGPKHIDQVSEAQRLIKEDPYSRRIIIDAWNPSDLESMALPPCHVLYQFYADPVGRTLSLQVYQRSADLFLGVPFDIAEGGLLLSMMAHTTGYIPAKLRYVFGDCHIYLNHIDQIEEQLGRICYPLPKLMLPAKEFIFDYIFEDFTIIDYRHHGVLKGEVAV